MCAIRRRAFLKAGLAVPVVVHHPFLSASMAQASGATWPRTLRRCRPSDAEWPASEVWQSLNETVGGRLLALSSPLDACRKAPDGEACSELFRRLKNPYFVGDTPALTQTSGWIDAWTAESSIFAIAAESPQDVAKAILFARTHRLRLVVKGGGHSYQGASNSADSLLIWTRKMQSIESHDAFVAEGCAGRQAPQPAVTVGAGALWMHVYDAVTTRGGRYVQGGGCATVGVAGLVQAGGFGSFSKRYGTAAGSLLQAEVVTADGQIRIVNACQHADLFQALKGGGGGTFGVLTKLTLKTHVLPRYVGGVWASIKAASSDRFRLLVAQFLMFYRGSLFNEHWGETVAFRPDGTLSISMLFQDLSHDEVAQMWKPFFNWVTDAGGAYEMSAPQILALPAEHLWDPAFLMQHAPGVMMRDDRPGASPKNVFWSSNQAEASWFIHGYESLWLPAALLRPSAQKQLVDVIVDTCQHWSVSLHFNKGLAGASEKARVAARNTLMNPAVLDAFALAIVGGEGPPAYPGLPDHEPNFAQARSDARRIALAAQTLRSIVPNGGSYSVESGFFQSNWRAAYWGEHYHQLLATKHRYDPDGLFFAHHGVGSDEWSLDGFTRVTTS